ncbi:MAG: PEP-CTERM sorting domain-containing protein [Armatimonadetes bacterium]|nr:PEP-CTERM sorting domain-containing protein [Armatimonadota bacterium]
MKLLYRALATVPLLSFSAYALAIDITTTNSPSDLADKLFSNVAGGVTIMGSAYTGSDVAAGTYRNLSFAPLSYISSGILLTTGDAQIAKGPNDQDFAGIDNGGGSETFVNYDGNGTNAVLNDVAKLSITFSSDSRQSLSFDFSFGSEEYFEWVNSDYNDTFLTFIDSNPITLSRDLNNNPITVNNQFFRVDNRPQGWGEFDVLGNYSHCNGTASGISELQYDGFTPVLKTTFTVDPGVHTLTFVIGDAGDNIYDSGVFISRALSSSGDDDGTGEDPAPEPSSFLGLGVALWGFQRLRRRPTT